MKQALKSRLIFMNMAMKLFWFDGVGRSVLKESDVERAPSMPAMRQALASKRRGLRPPTYEVVVL